MPDARGHFGPYGGMFVPETLMTAPLYYAERLTDRCHERRLDKDVASASNPKSKT